MWREKNFIDSIRATFERSDEIGEIKFENGNETTVRSIYVDRRWYWNLRSKFDKTSIETMRNKNKIDGRERERGRGETIVESGDDVEIRWPAKRDDKGYWTQEVVRCDSAGSVASGWENETLPGALNALGRETGSVAGTARLLSKPKPRNPFIARTAREVIDEIEFDR